MQAAPHHELATAMCDALSSAVLDKTETVEVVVATVLARGHLLIEDAPGVGKTLLARSLGRVLGVSAQRIQGTPDLLPADMTGVETFDPASGSWSFRPGPLFANVVLIDELNRITPRAQSALFEAMAEGTITSGAVTRALPEPYFVIATQNIGGDAGTFRLVPGQLDRFMVRISLGRPSRAAERALLKGAGGMLALPDLEQVTDAVHLMDAQAATTRVPAIDSIIDYVLDLVDEVRTATGGEVVSARLAQDVLSLARGLAVVAGHDHVWADDVQRAALVALGHRTVAPGEAPDTAGAALLGVLSRVPVPPPGP